MKMIILLTPVLLAAISTAAISAPAVSPIEVSARFSGRSCLLTWVLQNHSNKELRIHDGDLPWNQGYSPRFTLYANGQAFEQKRFDFIDYLFETKLAPHQKLIKTIPFATAFEQWDYPNSDLEVRWHLQIHMGEKRGNIPFHGRFTVPKHCSAPIAKPFKPS